MNGFCTPPYCFKLPIHNLAHLVMVYLVHCESCVFFLSRCVCLYVYAAPKVDSDYTHTNQPNNILITSQRFLHVLQTDKHKLKHLFIYHNGNGLTHSVHCKDVIVSLYLGFRQLYLLSSGPSGFEPCTRARFRSAKWHLFSVNVYGY